MCYTAQLDTCLMLYLETTITDFIQEVAHTVLKTPGYIQGKHIETHNTQLHKTPDFNLIKKSKCSVMSDPKIVQWNDDNVAVTDTTLNTTCQDAPSNTGCTYTFAYLAMVFYYHQNESCILHLTKLPSVNLKQKCNMTLNATWTFYVPWL